MNTVPVSHLKIVTQSTEESHKTKHYFNKTPTKPTLRIPDSYPTNLTWILGGAFGCTRHFGSDHGRHPPPTTLESSLRLAVGAAAAVLTHRLLSLGTLGSAAMLVE